MCFETINTWLEENDPRKTCVGAVELENKLLHTNNVVKLALAIADLKHSGCDRELLEVCARFHDVGRVKQFQIIGSFKDRVISHRTIGLEMLDNYISAHKDEILVCGEIPYDIQILRSVIYGHGDLVRIQKFVDLPTEREYVEIISDADDIENGLAAISYLKDEADKDAKGYTKNNPESIGRINPELFEYYRTGTKFNKMTMCHSYAEYFLFAGTLAMYSIKKYGVMAREAMKMPMYGYASVLNGYEDVFRYVMNEADANRAIAIMREAVCI